MPGLTEHLEILHAVGTDLMERAYKVRTDLAAADLGTMFLSEKVAKRIVEKFPTLQDTLKKSDPGYETFVNNAHTIVANLSPLFTVLLQLLEFRDNALVLLSEMSSQQAIAMYDMKLNELVLAGYYNLMLKYAKLHILLGILGSPQGRGRLGLSVYAQAFTVLNNGRAPPEYEALASYLEDYKFPVSKLQDDMIKVRLRVADTLLPLGMQIIRLSDTSSLRAEGVLSPLNEQKSTKPGEVAPPPVDPLLALLPEAKQWLVYGLLLYPDDLAEEGAVSLLIALLNASYVLPVHGSDVIFPHSEFDADSKTLFKWIKKKDEAKKFSQLIKESRITAWRTAGHLHATTRAVLITKLAHLHSAFLDVPSLLQPRFPVLVTALKLAQEEISWWALHADAVPDLLPRKEREADRDLSVFHPASCQALLRFGHAVLKTALNSKALITESAMARMSLLATSVNEKMAEVRSAITLPPELEKVCDQLPAHLSHASDVNCDLRGLRLNVMRLVTGLSKPAMLQQMGQAKSLAPFLRDLNAAAQLSLTIDVIEPLLRSATEPTALLADPIKLERIFVGALDAKPTDCLVMLELAARSTSASATSPLPSMLQRMAERINALLHELADHFRAQRTNPHGVTSILDVIQKGCTLCKALDSAQPLVYARPGGGQPVTISLQAWLREQFEGFVEGHVHWVIFPSPGSTEPRMPTTALPLFADLSHALAVLEPYINLDAHAMLDSVVVRELGALESAGPNVVANEPRVDPNVAETAAIRADGPIIDSTAVMRAQSLSRADEGDSERGGSSARAPPTIIQRLVKWLRNLAVAVQQPDGPQYVPGRRAFERTALDVIQVSALCRLVGVKGMQHLSAALLDVASTIPVEIGGVLAHNREKIAKLAMTFERTRTLDDTSMQLEKLPVLLMTCRALGIVLVARGIFQDGIRAAKSELLPPAVASFVHSLGTQQLPDGQHAGMVLPPVVELLGDYGHVRGAENDAPLQAMLGARCGIASDDASAWASLPYALALMLTLPEWASVSPRLADDGISGNVHCLVHAVHSLLCMAEPHMHNARPDQPASVAAVRDGRFAHRRFLEVSSLVLLKQRQQLLGGGFKPADVANRERCLASTTLVCEQLVQLAHATGYGDLQAYLPYPVVLSTYTAISQPVSVAAGQEGILGLASDVRSERQNSSTMDQLRGAGRRAMSGTL